MEDRRPRLSSAVLQDRDLLPLLRLLRRVERDLQHAILERRLRGVGVHVLRQRNRAEEIAVAALTPSAELLLLLPLALEDEDVVADLAMHVVLRHARKVGVQQELSFLLVELDLRRPEVALQVAAEAEVLAQAEVLEEAVHLPEHRERL